MRSGAMVMPTTAPRKQPSIPSCGVGPVRILPPKLREITQTIGGRSFRSCAPRAFHKLLFIPIVSDNDRHWDRPEAHRRTTKGQAVRFHATASPTLGG